MKRTVILISILLTMASSFVTAFEESSLVDIGTLVSEPSIYDKQRVLLCGHLKIDEQGNLFIYPNSEMKANYLDLVFFSPKMDNVRLEMTMKCVEASGTFRAYTSEYIGMGWMTSKIGVLKADEVRLCTNSSN